MYGTRPRRLKFARTVTNASYYYRTSSQQPRDLLSRRSPTSLSSVRAHKIKECETQENEKTRRSRNDEGASRLVGYEREFTFNEKIIDSLAMQYLGKDLVLLSAPRSRRKNPRCEAIAVKIAARMLLRKEQYREERGGTERRGQDGFTGSDSAEISECMNKTVHFAPESLSEPLSPVEANRGGRGRCRKSLVSPIQLVHIMQRLRNISRAARHFVHRSA